MARFQRFLSAFLRYFRPLFNGAGLLAILAVLAHIALPHFFSIQRSFSGRENGQVQGMRPVLPKLRCATLHETYEAPQRMQIFASSRRNMPEAQMANKLVAVDRTGKILDTFVLSERVREHSPLGMCGNSSAKEIQEARRLQDRLDAENPQVRSTFTGSSASWLSGRIHSYRFLDADGSLSRIYLDHEQGGGLFVHPESPFQICGQVRVINPSNREFWNVELRLDLLDSAGELVSSENRTTSFPNVLPRDTLLSHEICVSLDQPEARRGRHLRAVVTQANVPRHWWEPSGL